MVDRLKILDVMNETESRFPVDEWVVGDFHVWPLIRMNLLNLLADGSPEYGRSTETRASRLQRILQHLGKTYLGYVKASLEDGRKNAPVPSSTRVVFFGDGVSFVNLGDRMYDRLCEPLMEILESQSIEYLFLTRGHRYYRPRHTPSRWIQPQLDWIRLKSKLTGNRTPQGETCLPAFDDFLQWIQPQYPFIAADRFQLEWSVFLIQQVRDYYLKLFRQIKPAFAVTAQYYDLDGFAFCLACRQFDIPCMETQHGMQGLGNPFYARWQKHPQEGYESFPTIFWVWSDYEYGYLNEWTSRFPNCPTPVIGGNVYQEQWLSGDSDLVGSFDSRLAEVKKKYPGKQHILVTLQSRNQLEPETLNLLHSALNQTLETHVWWFRMHPTFMHDVEFFRDCFCNFMNTLDPAEVTDWPLYSLLRNLDLHMTHNSSTVLEAEMFGVMSVVYHQLGHDCYPEQVKAGSALYVQTPEAMLEGIRQQCAKRIPVSELKLKSQERLNAGRKAFLELVENSF